MISINPANRRGDKNVINGAKKTLNSVIKALPHGSNILNKIKTHLQENGIKNNAETITWMYIGLLKIVKTQEVISMMRIFKERMILKAQKPQIHENVEYIQKKRKRIQKYIQSASYLTEAPSKLSILQSIEVLFEYQNCSRRALQKMKKYIQQNHGQLEEILGESLSKIQESSQQLFTEVVGQQIKIQECVMMNKELKYQQFKTEAPKNDQQVKKMNVELTDLFMDSFHDQDYAFSSYCQELINFDSWDNYINLSDQN